jgi:hypothetical protein
MKRRRRRRTAQSLEPNRAAMDSFDYQTASSAYQNPFGLRWRLPSSPPPRQLLERRVVPPLDGVPTSPSCHHDTAWAAHHNHRPLAPASISHEPPERCQQQHCPIERETGGRPSFKAVKLVESVPFCANCRLPLRRSHSFDDHHGHCLAIEQVATGNQATTSSTGTIGQASLVSSHLASRAR